MELLAREVVAAINPLRPTLIVLRGLPGSGKSTLAKELAQAACHRGLSTGIVSADDYFLSVDGKYTFVSAFLPDAHQQCRSRCREFLLGAKSVSLIIIDNTNVQRWMYAPYESLASEWIPCGRSAADVDEFGATVVILECWLGDCLNDRLEEVVAACAASTVHGVPARSIAHLAAEWEPDDRARVVIRPIPKSSVPPSKAIDRAFATPTLANSACDPASWPTATDVAYGGPQLSLRVPAMLCHDPRYICILTISHNNTSSCSAVSTDQPRHCWCATISSAPPLACAGPAAASAAAPTW